MCGGAVENPALDRQGRECVECRCGLRRVYGPGIVGTEGRGYGHRQSVAAESRGKGVSDNGAGFR